MWSTSFLGQNIHFIISLFAALVFFAVFWLHFDAWLTKRKLVDILEWAGFLLLSLSLVIIATVTEQSVLGASSLSGKLQTVSIILRILGFVSIICSQILNPLQIKPVLKGLEKDEFVSDTKVKSKHKVKNNAIFPVATLGTTGFSNILNALTPVGAIAVAALYWRRATTGLERHLKPVALAFVFLFVYELLSLTSLWQDTTNPTIAKLVASFGWLWFVDQALLLVGSIILGRWVWRYLVERFVSQLFMIFTTVTLAIFLVTTVSFTYLLVNNVQKDTLNNLETAANVLNYAINNKKSESLANTEVVAENPAVASAIAAKDHNALTNLTSSFLADKKQTGLIITNEFGEVLLRAEDPNNWGDSISSDTLLQRAMIGQYVTSVNSKSGVLAPVIYIRSAAPIYNSAHQIIGAAVGSLQIDNTFVDGVKRSTGLDSSVYADNILSATTFLAPDGVSRSIGTKETSNKVQATVIKNGQNLKGTAEVINRQYSSVYIPLKDVDNTVVGMLFIGQPEDNILKTASRSIELTFVISVVLLIASILPAYFIARSIAKQVD